MAQDEYLDLALASAVSRWNDAEHAAKDQVEDGEQHRGILWERASGREQDFRPLHVAEQIPRTLVVTNDFPPTFDGSSTCTTSWRTCRPTVSPSSPQPRMGPHSSMTRSASRWSATA